MRPIPAVASPRGPHPETPHQGGFGMGALGGHLDWDQHSDALPFHTIGTIALRIAHCFCLLTYIVLFVFLSAKNITSYNNPAWGVMGDFGIDRTLHCGLVNDAHAKRN